LIYTVPPSPVAHLPFRSDSWTMTLGAAAKFSVGWMGSPVLTVLWPWAVIALVVPAVYLTGRFFRDDWRRRLAGLGGLAGLLALVVPALVLVAAMGHTRAKYPVIWSSRYGALEVPVAVVLYLMLVRCAAPRTLLSGLALWAAVCYGWNWPLPTDTARA